VVLGLAKIPNERYGTVRIGIEDYLELKRISKETMIPIVRLISVSVRDLKNRYKKKGN
jgi:hypothetical protein